MYCPVMYTVASKTSTCPCLYLSALIECVAFTRLAPDHSLRLEQLLLSEKLEVTHTNHHLTKQTCPEPAFS